MKDRRKVRAGLAAVAALCTVAAAPGTSLADGADGARAYETRGTRISGADADSGAPSLAAGRTYVDSLGPGEKRYYGVTLDTKSAAYVSAVAAPPPGADVTSYRDGVKVTLESPDGGICGTAAPKIETNGVAFPLADYASRQIESGPASCHEAGRYVVTVERQDGSPDSERWPVELRVMVEPPVKGGATGAAPEGSWSTPSPVPPDGTPWPRRGGRGFTDAPTLGSGVWKDEITPGETHFYRVPVDWGQRLTAAAELSADGKDQSTRLLDRALAMHAYNPARGLAKRGIPAAQDGDAPRTQVATAPVAYGNRYANTGSTVRAMSFSGGYFLAVTLNPPQVAPHLNGPVPVVLRVRVAGAARGGPSYDKDPVEAGFGLTAADRKAAKRHPDAADDDRMASPGSGAADSKKTALRVVGYAGIGTGTALVLGLGVWTLAARRRASTQRYGPSPGW
ncbi:MULTISPECIES: hypothetical protein [Streptomyces]|uniref:Aromatic ring-opening dioxygenase LigA n=1 Tax=Streptomyces melanosporofaciens TaxID=67327 RepID=A0A1H4QYW4_STRMJ|nr:hypothetical protein [Streptomyces melanosporofaciens]SEC24758.1 hypothetical protein SAMN04490356_3437 [Streptomyces melanosporofaciens]